jgi:hypothetical protein
MKTINLAVKHFKLDTDPADAEARVFDYREFLLASLERPTEGLTLKEVSNRLRILDVLQASKAGETIRLEDADHERLMKIIDGLRFAVVHPVIVEFVAAMRGGDGAQFKAKGGD